MVQSYSVEAILSAQDKNFTSVVTGAENAVLGLENTAQKSTGGIMNMAKAFGIGQIGANLATSAIRALSNGFGTLVGEMNDSQKAWSTFEGNMQYLGKTEQEITAVQASLQQFATETIYSASDMAQTYSQMAAIGVESTEAVVKGMGGLAASAENPAQAMKSMSQQMVQALSQPEMKWQDFRIMLEQAPAAMSAVAEHMGYSLDELVVAIQDGEIASADFAKAVSEVGTNEHFSELATEFKTVDQAMDGLVETVSKKLTPAFKVASQLGIDAIESVTDWIDSFDLSYLDSFMDILGDTSDSMEDFTEVTEMSADEIEELSENWRDMTLEEKQAQVNTMGKDDLESLMQLLGVDFDAIPDEYTKNAYMNAHGKEALEELLWVTGTWHDLTLEEKRAVLEAQIDNEEISEVIEQRDLWNEEEFISQLAEINMNDTDALQQVEDLINDWAEIQGLEPVTLDVDAEPVKEAGNVINTAISKILTAYEGIYQQNPILVSSLEGVAIAAGAIALGFSAVKTASLLWAGITTAVTVASTAIAGAMAVITSTTGLVVIGLGLLIATGWVLYRNWDSITQGMTDAWNSFVEAIQPASEVIQKAINAIKEVLGLGPQEQESGRINVKTEATVEITEATLDQVSAEQAIARLSEMGLDMPGRGFALNPKATIEPEYQVEVQGLIDVLIEAGVLPPGTVIPVDAEVEVNPTTTSFRGMEAGGSFVVAGGMSATVDKLTVTPENVGLATGGGLFGGDMPALNIDFSASIAQANAGMIAIQTAVQSRMVSIQNTVSAQMNGVTSSFRNGMASSQSTVTSMMITIQSAVQSRMVSIQNTVQGGMNGVISAFNSVSWQAYSAGSNAGASFASGINSQLGRVRASANALANAASGAMRAALAIRSPSRVFGYFADMSVLGYTKSMEDGIKDVTKVANDFALASIPDLNSLNYDIGANAGVQRSIMSHRISNEASNSNLESKLDEVLTAIENGQVIMLDNDQLVGGTLPRIDQGLQNRMQLEGRHSL